MLRRSIFMAPEGDQNAGTGTGSTGTGTGDGSGSGQGTSQQAQQTQQKEGQGTGTTTTQTSTEKPEEIKVTWPEGFQADEAMSKSFVSIMQDGKLTGAKRAQALADLYVKGMQGIEARHAEQVVQWAEEAKKSLGDKFSPTLAAAQKLIDRVAPPGFKEMLTKTGLGNHVDTLTMFAKLGELISEDRLTGGTRDGGGEKTRDEMLREAFPNSPDMWKK